MLSLGACAARLATTAVGESRGPSPTWLKGRAGLQVLLDYIRKLQIGEPIMQPLPAVAANPVPAGGGGGYGVTSPGGGGGGYGGAAADNTGI